MKDLVHRALEFHAFWLIIIYLVYRISVHLLLSQAKNFIFSSLRTQLLSCFSLGALHRSATAVTELRGIGKNGKAE